MESKTSLVKHAEVYYYGNFLTEQDTDTKHKGFIAQNEVDKFPEAYPKIRDDKYWFDPMAMVPYLMKAIQELEAEVAALKAS